MKTLNTYITEWKANTNNVSSIEMHDTDKCFVYKQNVKGTMKIVDPDWSEFKKYKDKIYIDGKKAELNNNNGDTKEEYDIGYHFVEIKDINGLENCLYMFYCCPKLIKAPLFDTSEVESMGLMFYGCNNLSEQTKQEWSKVYDFEKHEMKI